MAEREKGYKIEIDQPHNILKLPQRPEIQEMTKAVMACEVAHGMQKAATVLTQTMTKLQVQRLAKEEGLDPGSFFQSAEEAIQWLLRA